MNIFCPICGSNRVEEFLNHKNVPVHQNMLFIKQEEAIKITRGSLSIVLCLNCGFVFNADYDDKLLSYNAEYENTQNFTSI